MSKLLSFQFYPADWRADAVFSCSLAARGLWHEMMMMAHVSERRGYLCQNGLPIPDEAIARYCGCTLQEYQTLLAELERAGVPRRTPEGIIYSKRMVEDEKRRQEWRRRQGLHRKRDVTQDVTPMSRECHDDVTPMSRECKANVTNDLTQLKGECHADVTPLSRDCHALVTPLSRHCHAIVTPMSREGACKANVMNDLTQLKGECNLKRGCNADERALVVKASSIEKSTPAKRAGALPPSAIREQILSRDGFRCLCCGTQRNLVLSRADPAGGDGPANLQTLCRGCRTIQGQRATVMRNGVLYLVGYQGQTHTVPMIEIKRRSQAQPHPWRDRRAAEEEYVRRELAVGAGPVRQAIAAIAQEHAIPSGSLSDAEAERRRQLQQQKLALLASEIASQGQVPGASCRTPHSR